MPLILWSGGCDSTLVLHDALAAQEASVGPSEPVRTISIIHPNVNAAVEQKAARDAIEKALRKRYAPFDRLELAIGGTTNGEAWVQAADNNGGVIQAAVWLMNAALALRASEDLYAGYIKGDDIWHYRATLFEAFQTVQRMTYRTGSLVLPLEWSSKRDVICRLKHVGLYKHVWYCDSPENGKKGKPCGKCSPCKIHRTALWQLANDMG